MDDLYSQQASLGKKVEQMVANFKKDSQDRKTISYATKRIEQLDQLWAQFNETHQELLNFQDSNPDHPYFKNKYFESILKLQEGLRSALFEIKTRVASSLQFLPQERMALPSPTFHEEQPQANNEEVAKLIRRQNAIIKAATYVLNDTQSKLGEKQPMAFYNMKIERLSKYQEELSTTYNLIWENLSEDDTLGHNAEPYYELDGQLQDVIILLRQQLETLSSANSRQPEEITSYVNTQIKLPKIILPVFDGNYLKWVQFRDLYLQLIHNQNISNIQKMFYLTTNLTGEAKNLIKHLPITEENYNTAWDTIKNRYNNKRLLVTALLDKLLSQPVIQTESWASLKSLHDVTNECLLALKNMGLQVDAWDPIIVHLIIKKMDRATHALFEQNMENPRELSTSKDVLHFLENRFQSLEMLQGKSNGGSARLKHQSRASSFVLTSEQGNCVLCKTKHPLYKCTKFLAESASKRYKILNSNRLCINCMRPGHTAANCSSRGCTRCNKKHNTLIHFESRSNESGVSNSSKSVPAPRPTEGPIEQDKQPTSAATLAARTMKPKQSYVLLSTAIVIIRNHEGTEVECKAIIDSGSQLNFITERLAKRLNLKQTIEPVCIQGIGEGQKHARNRVTVQLQSRSNNFKAQLDAFILPQITGVHPSEPINTSNWPIPADIHLADPNFNNPRRIDLLIGAELFYQFLKSGQIRLGEGLPILQETVLGWVAVGKINSPLGANSNAVCCVGTEVTSTEEVKEQIEKFWKLEEITDKKQHFTPLEKRCELYFKQSTTRSDDGRFVVRLPFLDEVTRLGESKDTARSRLLSLERRFARDEGLRQQYVEFMNEYLKLQHMKEVDINKINAPYYIFPHHCVYKPDSSTTKLRVVFDGSAKTSSNVSLNDLLANGPTIQDDLFSILLRFRKPTYVFTADIEKMFRQIRINEADQKFQLILWRDSPDKEIKCFQLTTVTYGTTSAPYLATKCLQALAQEEGRQFPLASEILTRDFYMDDVMSGSDNLNIAVQMQSELISVLEKASFKLRKWCANHPRLLEKFQPQDMEVSLDFNDHSEDQVKTLGLTWLPKADSFCIKINVQERQHLTKRSAYSDIARLFDPLGIMAPIVVTAKMILQDMWRLKLDWDEELPKEIRERWHKFRTGLQSLNNIKFPRHVLSPRNSNTLQLHTFSDASEKAYGASVYIRSNNEANLPVVRLLCSKSRVAPINKITLPRLELCAAKLAVELTDRVKSDLKLTDVDIFYWTDSEIVLAWINSSSSSYHTFVANRIATIQELSLPQQWRHVPSKENPADVLSRGISPENLEGCHIWFYGPMFLHGSQSIWPQPYVASSTPCLERKKVALPVVTTNNTSNILDGINHKNSFAKLQRIMAYVLRFINNTRKAEPITSKNLTVPELDKSLKCILKGIQSETFRREIAQLEQKSEVSNESSLKALTPFLDNEGVIRVGGRLQNSNISYDAKHPMVLPYPHPISRLLMTDIHKENMHVGPQALLALTRQKFWPIKGKILARSIVHQCVPCAKANPKLLNQLMGSLPADRIQPARPFINSGVDFCGPIYTHYKIRGKRPQKSYVAVFCCFATKAAHLEVVTELTTEAFISALKRFMARRGHCRHIYCDNATNFVGASNQLKELDECIYSDSSKEKISSVCSDKGIDFHFIPPRAPHFGGLWEAAVKSAKHHLQHQLAAASLTYEQLETIVVQIEAILNSRPLTPMSSDPNDLTALTPGHFLIGEPLTSRADPHASPIRETLPEKYDRLSRLRQEFWHRWTQEYLSELQQRHKWKETSSNIKPGTMVIIKGENESSPLNWPLGRVIRVIRGEDNVVRVVDVQTATKVLRRAIHKLAPLPIEIKNSDPPEDHYNQPSSQDLKRSSNTDNDHAGRENPTAPKRNRTTLGSAVVSLLLTCLILPAVRSAPIETSPITSGPAIHFENLGQASIITNEWNLVIYYNLQGYWTEYEGLKNVTHNIKEACTLLLEDRERQACSNVNSQLLKLVDELTNGNELLTTSTGRLRNKRGAINIIGNIANSLFGVLDSEYAEQMSKTIDSLQNNENYLLELIRNQTSIVDSTVNLMKTAQSHISEGFRELETQLNARLNKIQDELDQKTLLSSINSASIWALMSALNFQRLQNSIIDILVDAHHGRISPQIISPKQLQQQLMMIKAHIRPTLKLPISQTNIPKFYHLMSIQGHVGSRHIIFRLKLPLLTAEEFELFKVIPVPVLINGSLWAIETSTPYLVINLHKDQYYPLNEVELNSCIFTEEEGHMCTQRHPVYQRESNISSCEVRLLNKLHFSPVCRLKKVKNEPLWIQLNNPNKWVYALKTETVLNAVCGGSLSQVSIKGSGLLTINSQCRIKHPLFTIQGHHVFSSITRTSYTPTARTEDLVINGHPEATYNLSVAQHLPNASIFEPIEGRIRTQLRNEIISSHIHPHDTHQYAVGYLSLFLIIIIILYILYIRGRKDKISDAQKPVPAPRTRKDENFQVEETL